MCDPVTAAVVLGGVAVANQYQQGEDAKKAQSSANEQAKAAATKQADLADQANNRANGKQPDVASLYDKNTLNAKGGQSGTMLTGSLGVDPKTLLLGKSTLLGA